MSKDSSAKYCQSNKERLQKSLMKNIELFPNKKSKKLQYGRIRNLANLVINFFKWTNKIFRFFSKV